MFHSGSGSFSLGLLVSAGSSGLGFTNSHSIVFVGFMSFTFNFMGFCAGISFFGFLSFFLCFFLGSASFSNSACVLSSSEMLESFMSLTL